MKFKFYQKLNFSLLELQHKYHLKSQKIKIEDRYNFSIKKTYLWKKLNLKENLFFSFLLKNFLFILIGIFSKEKNLVSKIFLMKIRLNRLKKTKKKFKIYKFIKFFNNFKNNIFLNDLLLFPIHKINFFTENSFNLKFYLKKKYIYLKIIEWFILINKKIFIFFEIKNLIICKKIYQHSNLIFLKFSSKLIEIKNFLFLNFSFFKGLISLLSVYRDFYCIKILKEYLIIGFLKMDFLKIYDYKKKNITKKPQIIEKKKFNFFCSKIFRFDLDFVSYFIDLTLENSEILPSKKKIPLKISANLMKNRKIFKKKLSFQNKSKKFLPTFSVNKSINIANNGFFSLNPYFDSFFILKKAKDFFNEKFVTIYIAFCEKVLREENIEIWLCSFFVQNFDINSGLLEIICNSISLHDLKFNYKKKLKIGNNFSYEFMVFKKMSNNFIESFTGYSLLCYIFQIKDRHNGNILFTPEYRNIHIDFGFILGNFPGTINFEADSFKLSREFLHLIGGKKSEGYLYFKELFIRGFFTIRKNFGKILKIARNFLKNKSQKKNKISNIQKRLKIQIKDFLLIKNILYVIEKSTENWKTVQYDRYQLYASGIQ
jgi:hypothetical protein